jgi:hypothetical protein
VRTAIAATRERNISIQAIVADDVPTLVVSWIRTSTQTWDWELGFFVGSICTVSLSFFVPKYVLQLEFTLNIHPGEEELGKSMLCWWDYTILFISCRLFYHELDDHMVKLNHYDASGFS